MPIPRTRPDRWSAAIPPVLAALVLTPLLAALAVSFASDTPTGEYLRFWGSARGWESLARTLRLAAMAALIAVPLGYALVVAAGRCGPTWTLAVVALSCSAMLVPASLAATAWTIAVARWWPWFNLYSLPVAATVLALRYFGLVAAIVWHERLRQVHTAPVERAFGVPAPTRWLYLRLRPTLTAMAGGAALVMLFCMNDHILPGMLLISTCGTQVMIEYVARMDPAGAAALAMPMVAVGAALLLTARWLIQPTTSATERIPGRMPAAGWTARVGGAVVSIAILAVALAAPVGVLVERTGTPAALADAFWAGRHEAVRTLTLAVVAASLCTVIAAPLATHWLRCRRAGKPTATTLVLLNLTAPASLLAIGVVTLTSRTGLRQLDGTMWPLVVACIARFLPVVTLLLLMLWRDESPLTDHAASVHGVGFWQRSWRVNWPRRRLSLLTAAVLCAVLVVTELEMSVMLAPPGDATLAVRLYTLIHTAPDRVVSALTLCILLMAAAGIALLSLLIAFASRRHRWVP